MDPTGEVAKLVAALVIGGATAGAGYTAYDSYHHPEKYDDFFNWRGFGNVVGGAAIGGTAGLAGEAVIAWGLGGEAIGGLGLGSVVGGGTLTTGELFVLHGTAAATSGYFMRLGGHGLYPEFVDPPTAGNMASDYAFGGVVGVAIPAAREFVGGAVETVRGATVSLRRGVSLAADGPWRPVGNTWRMLRSNRIRYGPRNIFYDSRTFGAVSTQYWRVSRGAQGKALHHWLVQNQSRWVPRGLRNAGINLLEVPAGLNTWMGGRLLREAGFRVAVLSTLGATGYTSYSLTRAVTDSFTSDPAAAPGGELLPTPAPQGPQTLHPEDPLAGPQGGIGGTGESLDTWSMASPEEATVPSAHGETK
jgi:hypothetical protein